MRKFTKEITALIASAAIGTAAGVGAFSASSEEIVQSAGVDMIPDETICTTEPEIPPVDGGLLPSDEWIEPTTVEELPPLAGDPLPPDEWIETTTEEEIPPLAGILMIPPDGDVNSDGSLDIADVVLLQKWLLADPDTELDNWRAADLYEDNRLDVFDLCVMKKQLIEKINEDPQNMNTSFKLQGVAELRNGNSHEEWEGYIARSEKEFSDIIKENEGGSIQDNSVEGIDATFFNDKSLVIIYSPCRAGNAYAIIDDMTIKDNAITVSTITKISVLSTPDMLYRRYVFCVDKNAAANTADITFNDTSDFYQYEDGNDVAKWYVEWMNNSK